MSMGTFALATLAAATTLAIAAWIWEAWRNPPHPDGPRCALCDQPGRLAARVFDRESMWVQWVHEGCLEAFITFEREYRALCEDRR